jgi:uncharacterized protein YecE (DUF72 family)
MSKAGHMKILVGTSGYSYKEWKGSFYPAKLASNRMLEFYAERLPAVEINNTFYRLPQKSVLQTWAGQVPQEFRFAIKASQRITHKKRLRDVEDETTYLFDTLKALEERLGAVLFQLPPYLRKDTERLAAFVRILPKGVPVAFEFRHESWEADTVHAILGDAGCAWCVADNDDSAAGDIPSTADWTYLRLRRSAYSVRELRQWKRRIDAAHFHQAYVFFKHEDEATGPSLAARFLSL